jgi:hypothetical protein
MRKTVAFLALAALVATPLLADYTVVLKDGTRYQAQAKWTMQGQKALVKLKSGQSLLIDPALIDVARSEQLTKLGMGASTSVISQDTPQATAPEPQRTQPTLGDAVRMRGRGAFGGQSQAADPATPAVSKPLVVADQLDARLKENFERAYENVGIYEHKLSGTNRNVHAELTADSEEKVFNSLSATAFLMVRNAGVSGLQIEVVEVFLKTTTGGAAGRFQMNRADADAVYGKKMGLPEYFVRRVIY